MTTWDDADNAQPAQRPSLSRTLKHAPLLTLEERQALEALSKALTDCDEISDLAAIFDYNSDALRRAQDALAKVLRQ